MKAVGSDTWRRPHAAALATAALMALVALTTLAGLLAGCGSVEGTYSLEKGDDAMKGFTLTLEDGDFSLAGPNPLGGPDVEIKGTYTVDGDTISLKMADGSESEIGTIDGDKLIFDKVTWSR